MQYLEVDIFGVYFGLVKIITLQAHSRHVLLCRDMASRVALVMAPPGIDVINKFHNRVNTLL